MVTITTPKSVYVNNENSSTYTLTWTNQYKNQYAIEILYKLKVGTSWLTTGKISQETTSYDLRNLHGFLGVDLDEIQYRLVVYYREFTSQQGIGVSGNPNTATNEEKDFSDASLIYSLIFNSGITEIAKIYDGEKTSEIPLFSEIKGNPLDSIKVKTSEGVKKIPLVDTTSILASPAKVAVTNGTSVISKSMANNEPRFTYDTTKMNTYGTSDVRYAYPNYADGAYYRVEYSKYNAPRTDGRYYNRLTHNYYTSYYGNLTYRTYTGNVGYGYTSYYGNLGYRAYTGNVGYTVVETGRYNYVPRYKYAYSVPTGAYYYHPQGYGSGGGGYAYFDGSRTVYVPGGYSYSNVGYYMRAEPVYGTAYAYAPAYHYVNGVTGYYKYYYAKAYYMTNYGPRPNWQMDYTAAYGGVPAQTYAVGTTYGYRTYNYTTYHPYYYRTNSKYSYNYTTYHPYYYRTNRAASYNYYTVTSYNYYTVYNHKYYSTYAYRYLSSYSYGAYSYTYLVS